MTQSKKNILSTADFDYTGLYATELEEAVLGALVLESAAINKVVDKLEAGYFYHRKNQLVYETIAELYKNREPIDILTVTEALKTKGKLEQTGGIAYIVSLTENVASSAHIIKHSLLVKEFYIKRQSILKMRQCEQKIKDGEDIADVLFQVGKDKDTLYEELVGNQLTLHISSA